MLTPLPNDGSLTSYVLDYLRLGPSFVYLHKKTGLQQYKTAADLFRSQLNSHPRTTQGQFWHKEIYVNQGPFYLIL